MPELDPFINGTENPAPAPPSDHAAMPPGRAGQRDTIGVEASRMPSRLRRPNFAVRRPGAEISPDTAARLADRRKLQAAQAAAEADAAAQPVQVSPATLPVSYEDGQVRVHLPFRVNIAALTRWLVQQGYFCAHPAETDTRAGTLFPESQGWGPDHDSDSYYPYWVYPDPERRGRSVMAFNPQPEDVVQQFKEGRTTTWVDLGEQSRALMKEWLPVLATHPDGTALAAGNRRPL